MRSLFRSNTRINIYSNRILQIDRLGRREPFWWWMKLKVLSVPRRLIRPGRSAGSLAFPLPPVSTPSVLLHATGFTLNKGIYSKLLAAFMTFDTLRRFPWKATLAKSLCCAVSVMRFFYWCTVINHERKTCVLGTFSDSQERHHCRPPPFNYLKRQQSSRLVLLTFPNYFSLYV